MVNKNLMNILTLSVSGLLAMTPGVVFINAEKFLLESTKKNNPNYTVETYYGLCGTFVAQALTNWITPSVIATAGPRFTIVLGYMLNVFYFGQFLSEIVWLFYFGSVITGVAAGLYWTAQGNFLAQNSTESTIDRNSGLFWATLQTSGIFGNILVYYLFSDNQVDAKTRYYMYMTMAILCLLACLTMILFSRKVDNSKKLTCQILTQALHLIQERDMILLCTTVFYSGLVSSLVLGVYSNAVAFTKLISGKEIQLITTSGMIIGTGEVIAGSIFSLFGKKIRNLLWGQSTYILIGFGIQQIAYAFMIINLPNNSPNGPTYDEAYIKSSKIIAFITAFLLGAGDALVMTQIFVMVGEHFADKSASAMAVCSFFDSTACAFAFAFTGWGIYSIVGILELSGIISTICFIFLEKKPTYVKEHEPDISHSKNFQLMALKIS